MDYDNPDFVDAVKKILRDRLAQLTDGIKDFKDSVSAHWKADEERYQTKPVPVSDLRADVPIRVQTETKRSKPERVWRYIVGALEAAVRALEAAAFAAVIFYTYFSYHQWQEMIRSNDVSMSSYRRARIDSNEQQKLGIIAANAAASAANSADIGNKNFIESNRPWIAQVPGPASDVVFVQRQGHVDASYKWRLANSGKRPARIIKLETTRTLLSVCTMKPDYSEPKGDVGFGLNGETSIFVLLPDGKGTSSFDAPIPQKEWNAIIGDGSIKYCIYISVKYIDLGDPNKIVHHTTDCQVLAPLFNSFEGCTIPYANAD